MKLQDLKISSLILYGSFFAIGIIFLLAILIVFQLFQVKSEVKYTIQLNKMIEYQHSLFKSIAEMESKERGYLLTGDKKFMQEYSNAKQNFENNVNELKEFLVEKKEDYSRLERVSKLIDEWRAKIIARRIEAKERGLDLQYAFNDPLEKNIFENLQKELNTLEAGLEDYLKSQIEQSAHFANRSILILLIGSIADMLLLFFIAKITIATYKTPLSRLTQSSMALLKDEIENPSEMLKMNEIRLLQESFNKLEKLVTKLQSEIIARDEKINQLTTFDNVTGFYNARYLNENLEREIIRAKRQRYTLSVMCFSIDNFKNFSDSKGFKAAEDVLHKASELVKKNIRVTSQDSGYRFRGDEILVILPGAVVDKATEIADRIRMQFAEIVSGMTISGGTTQLKDDDNSKTLVNRVDEAMYGAKRAGGNKIYTV
jgi:diguanylate cyclase (GGDEF)-like protein